MKFNPGDYRLKHWWWNFCMPIEMIIDLTLWECAKDCNRELALEKAKEILDKYFIKV